MQDGVGTAAASADEYLHSAVIFIILLVSCCLQISSTYLQSMAKVFFVKLPTFPSFMSRECPRTWFFRRMTACGTQGLTKTRSEGHSPLKGYNRGVQGPGGGGTP